MHDLRVGVIIDFDIKQEDGGTYSYYQTLLNGLDRYQFHSSIEIIFIVLQNKYIPKLSLQKETIFISENFSSSIKEEIKKFKRHYSFLRKNLIFQYLYKKIRKNTSDVITNKLEEERIDIIYYLKPTANFFNIPYIITHWDLAHKSTFPFPEISMNGNYEIRDAYSLFLNKALFVLCESERSIQELSKLVPIDKKKLKLLPIFSNSSLQINLANEEIDLILLKFSVKKDTFFLYPAQFWSLKNHYNLILGFNAFIKNNKLENFKLILCGSDKGNLSYIQDVIADLELKESVIITGFISDKELQALYKSACALVFPAFLGPTNMPLIEAAELHCPVLCSRLEGHVEILGDSAIYFKPSSPSEISDAMDKIYHDHAYRNALILSAYQRISKSKFKLENSLNLLNKILLEAKAIRKCWGHNK